MSKPLWIDGILGSQQRDTQGETLSVEGADISELEAGRGRWNDNHGKGFMNCLGLITTAKKIFKAEDCDDDRQRYYWEKVKTPYIYGKGYLFNDEDHPNAKACAAIIRNIHKTDCPLKVKLSVEGGVVARGLKDPTILARTKIHSCAVTFVPANQATLVEPLNLTKSEVDVEADMILIKSVLHLAQTNVPSFRHITRAASADKIEQNISKIMTALGKAVPADLKQELIKASLERRIAENVEKINTLVKMEALEKGKKELLGMYAPEHLESGKPHVEWAQTLPKNNWKEWAVKNHANNPSGFTNEHKTAISHFAGLNHPLVRDVPLSAKVSLDDGLQKLKAGEDAYKEKRDKDSGLITPENDQKKISHFGLNRGWFDLKKPYCEKEGESMGHCGNVEGQDRDTDNILSFRDITADGKHKPHLTFIENKGWLGETKGATNAKPGVKHHEAIVQLLKNPRIKGIAGGGYEDDKNFTFEDLDPKLQKEVTDANPNFVPNIKTPDNIDRALASNLPAHHKLSLIQSGLADKYHEQLVNDKDSTVRSAMAKFPNLSHEHTQRLINDSNPNVRHLIAKNPHLKPEHHEQLVNHRDPIVRSLMAKHPNLDLKYHEQLIKDKDPEVRSEIARREDLDPKHHEQLVNDISHWSREAVAQHENLDPKYHEQLVNDKFKNVRASIASHPNLDPKHHEKLVNDEENSVRDAMASRKDLDPKHHEKLVNDKSHFIRQTIAWHPNLDPKHHEKLVNDKQAHVRGAIAMHPNLDPKYQEQLLNDDDDDPDSHSGLAQNPNLDPKHHEQLVNDKHPLVREKMAQREDLDSKYHGQLVSDDDEYVRSRIAQNPNLDPKYHEQLLNDESEYVRGRMTHHLNSLKKALTAGYGGAGAPTGMTGGGVLQSESQELGPKGLSFITCDHCGKEQVYGKFQVKCRDSDCGKAFSMSKLEKYFQTRRK